MSQFGIVYRLLFKNFKQQKIGIYISPTDVIYQDTEVQNVFDLTGAATPLIISTINNDRDKFQPIRSKQAVIQFVSNRAAGLDVNTFSKGADDLWRVTIISQDTSETIFTGFLILSDNNQSFQPDPNVVTLTATDHLGVLKDIPLKTFKSVEFAEVTFSSAGNLVNFEQITGFPYVGQQITFSGTASNNITTTVIEITIGLNTVAKVSDTLVDETVSNVTATDAESINPKGKFRIAELIAMALKPTGLNLDLFVVNNLRSGSGQYSRQTLFSVSGQYLAISSAVPIEFFYPGQQVEITGTVSNNMTVDVISWDYLAGVTRVFIQQTITTAESGVTATFTDTLSTKHFYHGIFVDAKTYEREINVSEDCYTVLSKILGEDCFIQQRKGKWAIMRIDEFENLKYVANFDQYGSFLSIGSGINIDKSIGANSLIKWVNADALLEFIRPHGFVKETFNYETPQENPCNSDFSRGDFIANLDDVNIPYPDGQAYAAASFQLECVSKIRKNTSTNAEDISATFDYYLKRIYNDLGRTYEKERFLVVFPRTDTDSFHVEFLKFEGMPVGYRDRIMVSFDYRFLRNPDAFTPIPKFFVCHIRLVADDGTNYSLDMGGINFPNGGGTWKWLDEATFPARMYVVDFDSTISDIKEWQNITIDAAEVPKPGMIYIYLAAMNTGMFTSNDPGIYYANLTVDYYAFINGSYKKYKAQNEQVTRLTEGYLDKREKEVYLGDSTRPLFKGSMYFNKSGNFPLTQKWYSAAPVGLGYWGDTEHIHPYGYIQIFSVWNQFRGTDDPEGRGRGINVFSGSLLGLDESTNDWPDMMHRYGLTDPNQNTNDRYFMLISFSQDWKSCIWRGVFVEVYNTVAGKRYDDTHDFKYLT